MPLAIKPTDPMERIEDETRKEIESELEKDLAAMGIAVTAYLVELWGLSEKEKEKKRWEKALQRLAERKAKEGKRPWDSFKEREEGEGSPTGKGTMVFYTLTTAGIEEVDVPVEEGSQADEMHQPKEERAVDAALLERSPEPIEEVVASPLIEEEKLEEAEALLREPLARENPSTAEEAMDIIVVESPPRIEVAMAKKEELAKVIGEREKTLKELLEKAKEESKKALEEWIRKHLPPLLRAKYLLLLERLGPGAVAKAARRDLEVLGAFRQRLHAMGVKEIVKAARRAGRKIIAFLKRLL